MNATGEINRANLRYIGGGQPNRPRGIYIVRARRSHWYRLRHNPRSTRGGIDDLYRRDASTSSYSSGSHGGRRHQSNGESYQCSGGRAHSACVTVHDDSSISRSCCANAGRSPADYRKKTSGTRRTFMTDPLEVYGVKCPRAITRAAQLRAGRDERVGAGLVGLLAATAALPDRWTRRLWLGGFPCL